MMKINIFEGARRITYTVVILWIFGAVIIGLSNKPYVTLNLVTYGPNLPFELSSADACNITVDAKEYIYRKTLTNHEISINLCFKAFEFKNGQMLVPYLVDQNRFLFGNEKYSSQVTNYTNKRANDFFLMKNMSDAGDKLYSKSYYDQIISSAQWGFGGCFVIWVFATILGWIVRGFAGIPTGEDRRPTEIQVLNETD